ncbi:hypothetical protein SIID45300_01783 [Candidatus Magnetaquicoccaceae bacterium FCR-1]|uniref:Uncharacterized protein n=1 Tax=Candidatus Magnetaquiglobus chichijimensis TaxID=3141448 RepID=A0ABQ0C9S5_9PROT
MAKYTITHTCGHTSVADICGPVAARQGRADWMGRQGACNACLQAERAAESAKAAIDAKESGLPALVGSDKQVAWAETIRANAMQIITSSSNHVKAMLAAGKVPAHMVEQTNKGVGLLDSLIAETSASRWIDIRTNLETSIKLGMWVQAQTK